MAIIPATKPRGRFTRRAARTIYFIYFLAAALWLAIELFADNRLDTTQIIWAAAITITLGVIVVLLRKKSTRKHKLIATALGIATSIPVIILATYVIIEDNATHTDQWDGIGAFLGMAVVIVMLPLLFATLLTLYSALVTPRAVNNSKQETL